MRTFIPLASVRQSRDSITDVWGERTPHDGEWPIRVDEQIVEEPDHWIQSTCVLCSTGCAVDIGVKDNRLVGVRGRAVDRVNRGRLGPKGLHGWMANQSGERLTAPLIRRANGRLEAASWEEAFDRLISRSRDLIDRYGGGTIGFYNSGHNPAYTQTVLWARILDRLHSANRPALVVADPRRTPTAAMATVHLAPRLGSNLALMNGLLHLIIKAGRVDREWVDAHTVGYQDLEHTVSLYHPGLVSRLTGVPRRLLEEAAEILGGTRTLVSTVLQGVYQSMHATASAVQVNNLHLIRGLIGKPGSTVFQMNGQPTAQNTRECGANGELVAFLNYKNPDHVAHLARHWNIDVQSIPHHVPPTHAMSIFRHAEEGSLRMLWIIGTNPAVSLPELHRIRRVLKKPELFVVVQDGFLSETAALADLVLPAAIWGEKTGCFTNADRTVHISHKAVDPPGQARSDFDIFIEYADRMDFRDKDGAPLIKWRHPEAAFDDFKQLTRGRPCDYSGLTYAKLSEGSGIQWPCNEQFPGGKERLYEDGRFNTAADYCEIYGHDIMTGAAIEPVEYHAQNPNGRAKIKPAEYRPPVEEPDDAYPLWLTTGRIVYHWHTRTKTGRVESLNDAAPDVFVQLSSHDAANYALSEGDRVRVQSRRGSVEGRVSIGDIAEGHLFIPFHYGYWDDDDGDCRRAANELTLTGWDPVSKQPHFKFAAVRLEKISP